MDRVQQSGIAAVAVLGEPTRSRLYDYVVSRREPVGRDEVAAALGIARTTAAFHLERLVEDGLLDVEFARRSGRSGPGAGRPAKLYRRADRQIEVTLPARRYELASRLLAEAIDEADRTGESPRAALSRRAAHQGRRIGEDSAGKPAAEVLAEHGFEPVDEGATIRLGNCPFHALVGGHTDLVCGMNLDLLTALLEGLGDSSRRACLDPEPGFCCVRLVPSDRMDPA
ncbi:helix-turn-helix transcriptional regulator [Rhodococcus phenolicus]|uniref:helix-turn-helix transcriptional regulator n=1 Tax=Rhodococcus phenolicus TaxID=263849 RepID=UPI000834A099|nr:helix-turn-helix domain-containing protein [Rhodococcus phenolicus]